MTFSVAKLASASEGASAAVVAAGPARRLRHVVAVVGNQDGVLHALQPADLAHQPRGAFLQADLIRRFDASR